VHVFGAAYRAFLLAPLPALLCARSRAIPVVLNYHNGEAPDHLERSAIARRAARQANRVVVPSRYLVAVFAHFGVRAIPIANILDFSRFRFRECREIRPRLISTRNFHTLYNVGCTLRAFRVIQDRWPEATLTLAGDGPHRPVLERLSQLLGLQGVQFLGRVSHASMPALYAEHDVYIQSPDVDNDPNSIAEAFATGLPVVSTDVGGVSTMLTDGDQGLLAPRNDHRSLAAQVLRVIADRDLAQRLVQHGRQACDKYRWSVVRKQWLQLYSELVERSSDLAWHLACSTAVTAEATSTCVESRE
jgi:glycosyltransferase involved in cell wall biosynthesis